MNKLKKNGKFYVTLFNLLALRVLRIESCNSRSKSRLRRRLRLSGAAPHRAYWDADRNMNWNVDWIVDWNVDRNVDWIVDWIVDWNMD